MNMCKNDVGNNNVENKYLMDYLFIRLGNSVVVYWPTTRSK